MIALATGAAWDSTIVLAAGWSAVLAAAAMLWINLLASLRAAARPLTMPARLLALAQTFLLAGLTVAVIETLVGGVNGPFTGTAKAVLAVLLLAGWIGLTVAGSLLHLLAILARIRLLTIPMPRPRPSRDRALTAAAGTAIMSLALSKAAAPRSFATVAAALTLAVTALVAAHVIALAGRALGTKREPDR